VQQRVQPLDPGGIEGGKLGRGQHPCGHGLRQHADRGLADIDTAAAYRGWCGGELGHSRRITA
jgi:hypothetical protein